MRIPDLAELLLTQFPTVILLTWKAAAEKQALYKLVDDIKDAHDKQLSLLDKNLSLLSQESQTGRMVLSQEIAGCGRRFSAKIERMERRTDEVVNLVRIEKKIDKLSQ